MKGHFTKDLLFEDWSQELANKIKSKPQIKNQWKKAVFEKMYKSGLTVAEAFRCWYCAH